MWAVISFLVLGLVAGLIARALVSGPGPKGLVPTMVLGMIGSVIGGFLGYLAFGKDLDEGILQPAGIFGSIVGAVIALLVYRRMGDRR